MYVWEFRICLISVSNVFFSQWKFPPCLIFFTNTYTHSTLSLCFCHSNPHPVVVFVLSSALISENYWLIWTDKAHLCLCHTAWAFVIILSNLCFVQVFVCVQVLPIIMTASLSVSQTHTHTLTQHLSMPTICPQYYIWNDEECWNIPQLLYAERAYAQLCVCVPACIDTARQHNLY